MEGGKEEYMGTAKTGAACASLVMREESTAMGATWSLHDTKCYAEFGDHIVSSSKYKTCLFKAGKMCVIISEFIFQQIQLYRLLTNL